MKLRKLELKDAPLMLEWMKDHDVCRYMQRDFNNMELNNCEDFIRRSSDTLHDLHMAIVDDSDEYMGTVSLKDIDYENGIAEFAITVRKAAMGKGYSIFGMREIIALGLDKLGLNSIIWCVSKQNLRANRFYDKNGFQKISNIPERYKKIYGNYTSMNWYLVKK